MENNNPQINKIVLFPEKIETINPSEVIQIKKKQKNALSSAQLLQQGMEGNEANDDDFLNLATNPELKVKEKDIMPSKEETPSKTLTTSNNSSSFSIIMGRNFRKIKRKIIKFLDSTPSLIFLSLLTIFALFAADIQAACLRIEVDEPFNIIQCAMLGIFTLEWILNIIAKKNYVFSFFFWLDLLSTISLFQDIDYIMNPIMGYGPTKVKSGKSRAQAAKAIAQVSSAARATRVLRVIRIVRLIRMVKIYKNIYIAKQKEEKKKKEEKMKEMMKLEKEMHEESDSIEKSDCSKENIAKMLSIRTANSIKDNNSSRNGDIQIEDINDDGIELNHEKRNSNNTPVTMNTNLDYIELQKKEEEEKRMKLIKFRRRSSVKHPSIKLKTPSITQNEDDDEDEDEKLIKESKIARLISDSITKKVILLMLILLVIFPLLSEDFYATDTTTTYSLIAEYYSNSYQIFHERFEIIPYDSVVVLFDPNFPPLNITINGTTIYTNKNYTNSYFRYKEVKSLYSEDGFVFIVYSVLKETKLTGLLNVIQTLFVCVMLAGAAMLFERDANKIVLTPLEIMLEIVENVAKDPINAKNVENLQTGIKAAVNKDVADSTTKDNYEVSVIKSAIIKISALLAIGFGEAGGEIIKKNLSSGQELNPRLGGKTKNAIFGFCDIRDFEKINLALEERTILLVNEIAEIVHSSVDRFNGSTNKNIGEAFLNVWKFYNEAPVRNHDFHGKQINIRKDNLLEIDPTNVQVSITADMSVLAFLRIIRKINKKYNILNYRNNEAIIKVLPNFKLNMGFGLHMGYGIEGAIGSTYKIDASYLSPNVNIAARLESATRQFGVPLLISGVLYTLLSKEMQQLCRFIDCVMVKGSQLPLDLYTIDVNLDIQPQNEKQIKIMGGKEKRKRFQDKKELFNREVDLTKSAFKVVLEKSSFIELLNTNKTEVFYATWNEGMKMYKEGLFSQAKEKVKECLKIDPSDGPAKTLIRYFDSIQCRTPCGWSGVRELTSK